MQGRVLPVAFILVVCRCYTFQILPFTMVLEVYKERGYRGCLQDTNADKENGEPPFYSDIEPCWLCVLIRLLILAC